MQIGVHLPASGPDVSPDRIATAARLIESHGFHSIWLGDHVVYPIKGVDSFYPYAEDNKWRSPADSKILDPLLVLGWAGAAAPTLHLGTSVMILPLRNPILLAKQLATLDYLTGGRVIFGAGVGWMEEEFDLIGAPFKSRGPRANEMIEIMRAFWSGETVTYEGEHWQLPATMMQPAPERGTIPLVWGGHSNAALRRVARLGDGWQPTQLSLEEFENGLERLREYCEQYGRDWSSVQIVARPGRVEITPELLARYRELGAHILILDPSLRNPDLPEYKEELQRMAEVCELESRY
jgi:probable F420-dependent oxidoreductase